MGVKKGIRNSIILPILSYASDTWTWNVAQQAQIRAVEKLHKNCMWNIKMGPGK